jgi:hypothetical protein
MTSRFHQSNEDHATEEEVQEFIAYFNMCWINASLPETGWKLSPFHDPHAPHRHPGSVLCAYLDSEEDHRTFIHLVDPFANLHGQTWNLCMRIMHSLKLMHEAEKGGREDAIEHALDKLRQLLK